MRPRAWLIGLTLVAAACGAFAEGNNGASDLDGGTDGGVAPEATQDDGPPPPEAGVDAMIGPAPGAPCSASKICIDFESPAQRVSPFGFTSVDTEVDSGIPGLLLNNDGFDGGVSLWARSVDGRYSRAELKVTTLPSQIRVRAKVRSVSRDAGDSTSTHVLLFTCSNSGDNLAVKLTLDDELSIGAGSSTAQVGTYAPDTWIPLDALVEYGPSLRRLTLARLDAPEKDSVASNDACEPPVSIRVQSSLAGGKQEGDFIVSFDDIAIDWN